MIDFDTWRFMADQIVTRTLGIDIDTCPDWGWRDAYDGGLTYSEAACEFIEDMRDHRL